VGKQAVSKVHEGAEGTDELARFDRSHRAGKLGAASPPKREVILIGMLEEVGANGYDATSVRTVLDRTGLYRQAFYDHFRDKSSCYLVALEAGVRRLETLAAAAAASEESWRGKLRAGLAAILDFLDAEPDIGRALVVEVHAAGPDALQRRAEAMKRATDFIDLARGETDDSQSPPGIAAEGIIAGIHSMVHSRLSTGADHGFGKLLPEFMYFAVLPYFGAAAASAEMAAARTGGR
jgi:AcrR family transcriptional regulator